MKKIKGTVFEYRNGECVAVIMDDADVQNAEIFLLYKKEAINAGFSDADAEKYAEEMMS